MIEKEKIFFLKMFIIADLVTKVKQSALFLSEIIAKLDKTLSTALQNKDQTSSGATIKKINQQQQNQHLRTDISQSHLNYYL